MSAYKRPEGYFIMGGEFHIGELGRNEDTGVLWLEIRETRKNGQEDTHAYGEAYSDDGGQTWQWESENFSRWYDDTSHKRIIAFLNANKHPDLESK